MKKIIVTIEGGDGTGKSTLSNTILTRLKQENINTISMPLMLTNTVSARLRNILISDSTLDDVLRFNSQCFGSFYAFKNAVESFMNEASTSQDTVLVLDRTPASTFAYNIVASETSYANKMAMLHMFTQLNDLYCKPVEECVISILTKVAPNVARNNILKDRGSLDVMESLPIEYHENVQHGYSIYYKNNKLDFTIDYTKEDYEAKITSIVDKVKNAFA